MKVCGLILAGGKSKRMGYDKALITINNKTILQLLYNKLAVFCDEVYVVLGKNYNTVTSLLRCLMPKARFIFNKNFEKGMASSIKAGFREISSDSAIILQMIDQPFVDEKIYTKLIKINSNFVVQPVYNNLKKAHPILFYPDAIKKFLAFDDALTLKDFLNNHKNKLAYYNTSNKSVLHNLNTVGDWVKIEEYYK